MYYPVNERKIPEAVTSRLIRYGDIVAEIDFGMMRVLPLSTPGYTESINQSIMTNENLCRQ